VDTKFDLPLSQHNCSVNHCDKEKLCDGASIIHAPQLLNEIDSFVLTSHIYAERTNFQSIATEQDELKLLSSLNTLGYIEFHNLCARSSVEEKFKYAGLLWLSRCTYHFIGNYNCKGEYMVHRIYISLNLKSPFLVQKYDQLESCNCYNFVMSNSSSFVLKKQVKFQEGEQYWLLPTTCPPIKFKPRTVCYQEGENDEDMTPSDTTIVYKVSSFLYLYSNFWYNSLGSTCTCHYLNVGTNVS
jgi:hypothetical protein